MKIEIRNKKIITANENLQHQMEHHWPDLDLYHFHRLDVEFHRITNVYQNRKQIIHSHTLSLDTYKNLGVFNILNPPCSRGKISSRK